MSHKVITCFFCFEQFEVSLEISTSFTGNNIEIYDCEICCNPNKLDYVVYGGEININNAGDRNELIVPIKTDLEIWIISHKSSFNSKKVSHTFSCVTDLPH